MDETGKLIMEELRSANNIFSLHSKLTSDLLHASIWEERHVWEKTSAYTGALCLRVSYCWGGQRFSSLSLFLTTH
jgi:hypothetical protein